MTTGMQLVAEVVLAVVGLAGLVLAAEPPAVVAEAVEMGPEAVTDLVVPSRSNFQVGSDCRRAAAVAVVAEWVRLGQVLGCLCRSDRCHNCSGWVSAAAAAQVLAGVPEAA